MLSVPGEGEAGGPESFALLIELCRLHRLLPSCGLANGDDAEIASLRTGLNHLLRVLPILQGKGNGELGAQRDSVLEAARHTLL